MLLFLIYCFVLTSSVLYIRLTEPQLLIDRHLKRHPQHTGHIYPTYNGYDCHFQDETGRCNFAVYTRPDF